MMKSFHFIFIIFICSCHTYKSILPYSIKTNVQSVDSMNTLISIHAEDLSENLTKVSTQSDEILLMAYLMDASYKNQKCIIYKIQPFNSKNNFFDYSAYFPFHTNNKIMLFLIELDDHKTPQEMIAIFNKNFENLIIGYQNQKEDFLEKLIGADDLLGQYIIDLNSLSQKKTLKVKFSGIHLFDSFQYNLEVKRVKRK